MAAIPPKTKKIKVEIKATLASADLLVATRIIMTIITIKTKGIILEIIKRDDIYSF